MGKNSKVLDIRGGLGVQVFEYLVGLARVPDGQTPKQYYEKIVCNIGGGENIMDHSRTSWLDKVFDLDLPYETSKGLSKQHACSPFNFQQIVNKDIVSQVQLKQNATSNGYKILHIRGRDRSLVAPADYLNLAEEIGSDFKILTNEPKVAQGIIDTLGYGENISSDPVTDWFTLVGAKEIHGGLSGFSTSAMLFDHEKVYRVYSKENSQGIHQVPKDLYDSLEVFRQSYFKNMEWI